MVEKELIQFLQEQKEETVLVYLQGIIETKIVIEQMHIKKQNNKLILENKIEKEENIGFNLSQLMKITQIHENEVLLEFDPSQKVIIKTKDKIKEAITIKSNS